MKVDRIWIVGGIVAVVAVAAGVQTASFRDSNRPEAGPSPRITPAAGDIEVPEVTGLELETAETALREVGLASETFFQASDEPTLWSTVTAQVPEPGAHASDGSPITLYVSEAARPPVRLPEATGGNCPASEPRHHEHLRVALGDGRILLGSATESGVIRLHDPDGRVDTLWTSEDYRGPVLIRGGELGGDGQVTFEQSPEWAPRGPTLAGTPNELRFQGRPPGDLGWHGLVTFSEPGCYGFQIDGRGFTEHIVVAVKKPVAP